MKMKYIFLDIDGTLLDHAIFAIPQSAKAAIQKAAQNGHKIFIDTGRPVNEIDDEIKALPLSGYIYHCGAKVVVNQQILFQSYLPYEEVKKTVAYMQNHDIWVSLDTDEKNFSDDAILRFFHETFIENVNDNSELAKTKALMDHMHPIEEIMEEDFYHVLKFGYFSKSSQTIERFLALLPDTLHGYQHVDPTTGFVDGEVTLKGINKASGMDVILDYFQGNKADTIAFGDSYNDKEMIEHAAIGVAMGNSDPRLFAIADFIAKDVHEDGLADAFQKLHLC